MIFLVISGKGTLLDIIINLSQQMSLFRSAPMKYYELFIPSDEAYHVVEKLSRHSFVEFTDANEAQLHKPYYNSINRCV